ncbi:hypothetical protein IFR05_004194 [Cadophora sp. M221]|nr:hypothetical protein IFR05_004194 [Cadophora sp. M221]
MFRMRQITDTVYVIGDDGSISINRDARGSGNERVSPLKRPRVASTASSCTLKNLTPDTSESDVEIIEQHVASKHVTQRQEEPEIQIIDSTATSANNLDVPAQKRAKSNLSSSSDARPMQPHQQAQAQPVATAYDIDGFEELKYGPGGIINIDDLEERFEAEFYGAASQAQARAPPTPARNLPIRFPQVELDSHSVYGIKLKKGKTVEFLDGNFLKIGQIIKNSHTGEVAVRGWPLKRCSHLHGLLPKKLNELCFVLEVELDDPRPTLEQSMVQVGLEGLVKIRHLVSTNYPHPHLGFPRTGLPYETKDDNLEYVKDYERLVVRWKFVTFYDNAAEHSRTPVYPINIRKKILIGLAEEECTPGCYMDPAALRHKWRGDTIIGGSGSAEMPTPAPVSLDVETTEDPYECHECGMGFKRAQQLLGHFQATHEKQSRQSQAQSQRRSNQYRPRRMSVIEILDDEENDAPQRRWASRKEIEDIRFRLNSILSLDGEHIEETDKVCIVGRDGRRIDVDLTTPEPSARQESMQRNAPGQSTVARASFNARQRNNESRHSSYTYGDAFCGAGGTTRGAVAAALKVLWGLDLDKNAGKTWKANFPTATHYEMWAHDLVATINASTDLLVDILHLSPPCQVFSPVHTRVGKNDQQNFDSLFACDALVHKARPRIITLEQTFGILHPKFEAAFNSLIQTFTSYGYSVSYQIVQFHRYGLAQTRRRLIIVAACPGETLPEVPNYTHSKDTSDSLKPLASVRNVLNKVPRSCPNHNVQAAYGRGGLRSTWDASGVVPTITCNGGERAHPDGERGFTDRELAALQSFPHHHVFHGNAIKKQIGNAVPPLIAEILFKAIIKHLRMVDKAEQLSRAEVIN